MTLSQTRPRRTVPVQRKFPYVPGMEKPTFLPQEATEAQRRDIIQRAYASGEAQGAIITDNARAAYNRYIAGDITLEQAVDLAMSIYPKPAAQS